MYIYNIYFFPHKVFNSSPSLQEKREKEKVSKTLESEKKKRKKNKINQNVVGSLKNKKWKLTIKNESY